MTAGPVKRRVIVNAALVGAVLALAGLLWFNPGGKNQPRPLIPGLDKQRVKTIRIEQHRSPAVVLEKRDGHWRMLEPFSAAADDLRIATVLNIIDAEPYARYPMGKRRPADFGLEPARAVLHLNDRQLDFGGTDPLENRRYLQLGDTLYLVDDTVLPLLAGGAAMLVDRHIVPRRIPIAGLESPRLAVRQSPDGVWRTDSGTVPDDAAALEDWVARWRNAESLEVRHRPDLHVDTSAEIKIIPEDRAPLQYTVVRNENERGLYRAETGLFYRFDQSTLDRLLTPPSETELQQSNKAIKDATENTEK